MSVLLRVTVCLAGIMLIVMAIRSVIVSKFTERQSLFWITCGIVVIIFGIFPPLSAFVASIFGVQYAPSIIFAIAIVMALYGIFNCYQSIAGLHKQVQELAMHVSLLNQENSMLLKALENIDAPVPKINEERLEKELAAK